MDAQKERENVIECLNSTWISSKGKFINQFENSFSDFIGIKHSATVSNGTVALHVALLSIGIGKGDEVIVPSFTYVASVNAIAYTGATPVFIDSDQQTWQMASSQIENNITSRTNRSVKDPEKNFKKNKSYNGCSYLWSSLPNE